MLPTGHDHLPFELRLNIMRRLSIIDREAYASVCPELQPAYADDYRTLAAPVLQRFDNVVGGSDRPLRIAFNLKAWVVWKMIKSDPVEFWVFNLESTGGCTSRHVDYATLLAMFRPVLLESALARWPVHIMDHKM